MAPVETALLEEVRSRRSSPAARERDDILSMLERAHDRSGSPMSEPQLRDELLTLLSDGPTSTSLAWAFERLLRHPDKLALLREEVLAGADDTYAEAVMKETLRLCPVVPLIMRKLHRANATRRAHDSRRRHAAPCPYLIHRREDIYPHARDVHARALPRDPRARVCVDSLRGRRASLPGRGLRAADDQARDPDGAQRGRAAARR